MCRDEQERSLCVVSSVLKSEARGKCDGQTGHGCGHHSASEIQSSEEGNHWQRELSHSHLNVSQSYI